MGKSGVPEAVGEQPGGESFPTSPWCPVQAQADQCGGLRLGWIELRGSSPNKTVNFGLGLESVETRSPQSNMFEKQNIPNPGVSPVF